MRRPKLGQIPQSPTATIRLDSEFVCAKHCATSLRAPACSELRLSPPASPILLSSAPAKLQQSIKQGHSQGSQCGWVVLWRTWLETPLGSEREGTRGSD